MVDNLLMVFVDASYSLTIHILDLSSKKSADKIGEVVSGVELSPNHLYN